MKKIIYISLLIVVLSTVGCKMGPTISNIEVEEYKKYVGTDSTFTVITDTTETADSLLALRWWEMFNDTVLDTLIYTALENNKDVKIAAAKVLESRAALGYTRADMYPKIGYQAQIGRRNSLGSMQLPAPGNNLYGGANLSWEIDFWGKYRRANEAAKADFFGTEFAQRSVQIEMITAVAQTYFKLLDFRLRLEISEKTVDLRDSSLVIIQAKFDGGVVAEIDLNQAQVQKEIAEAAVPLYKRSVIKTEYALSILLGENPHNIMIGKSLLEQDTLVNIPLGLPSDILTNRPDILLAEQQLYSQNAKIGIAVAERFPSISLTGMFGGATSDLTSFNTISAAWSLGGDLLGPLFYFNKRKRKVEIERARTEQVLYAYEKAVISAFQEVESSLTDITTLREELKARENHVIAALNAQMLAQKRYDGGVTSYLELLEMQRQAFDAELGHSKTLQELLSSYVLLYKSLGGGWLSLEEEQTAKDEARNKE